MRDVVAGGGRVLFVGTKRQATEPVSVAAKRCAQYYVNHRWLGGTLTNWQTISHSIKRLRNLEETLGSAQGSGLTKKELLQLMRERDKLERSLGGIKDMGGLPSMLFVIDTNKESIAVAEARKLEIPVAAILDSNSDPDGIAYPIPGNDDASRAIALYCDLAARAVIDGLSEGQTASGVDLGASEVVLQDISAGQGPAQVEASPLG
jgi:small subunit ribosomal protein S2